jgi:hypothetical protein
MEPKNSEPNRVWSIQYMPHSQTDAEMLKWIAAYLEAMMDAEESFHWDLPDVEPEDVIQELAQLDQLDAQVQGDHHPQALAWILNSCG